jgi:hypothetical protein
MLSACLLVAAMSLAQGQGQAAAQLRLTNDRFAHGIVGATRADAKFLPGDIVFLVFDIEGLQVDDRGRSRYSTSLEFIGKGGKPVTKSSDAQDLEAQHAFGTNRVPSSAFADIGTETEPGDYTMRVTVTDRIAKKSQTLAKKFQVLPKTYGIVRTQLLYFSPNPQAAMPAPPVGVVGQVVLVNCGVVGFERERSRRQPALQIECRVLDESGKPLAAKPDVLSIEQDVPEKHTVVEVPFFLQLARAGRFSIELKATDRLSKKTATATLSLTVQEIK